MSCGLFLMCFKAFFSSSSFTGRRLCVAAVLDTTLSIQNKKERFVQFKIILKEEREKLLFKLLMQSFMFGLRSGDVKLQTATISEK